MILWIKVGLKSTRRNENQHQPFISSTNALEAIYYEPETTPFRVNNLLLESHNTMAGQIFLNKKGSYEIMVTDLILDKKELSAIQVVLDVKVQATMIQDLIRKLQIYWHEKKRLKQSETVDMAEFILEDERCHMPNGDEIIDMAPSPFDNSVPEVQDPIEEVKHKRGS